MALVKGRGWRRKQKAPPPEPIDPLDKLVEKFHEQEGILHIKIEDGGYTLIRGRNFKGFPLVVYYEGRGARGSAVSASYGHPVYGSQLLFSPSEYTKVWTEDQMLRLVIPVIQSTPNLHKLTCGYWVGNGANTKGRKFKV